MPTDPTVLKALSDALSKDSENLGLRMHLATLLADSGRTTEALAHCVQILASRPDYLEALKLAAISSGALGETVRADGYRRLYDALSWKQTESLLTSLESPPISNLNEFHEDQSSDRTPKEDANERKIGIHTTIDKEEFFGTEESGHWHIERPAVTLADVAGMSEVKRRLNIAFLGPLKNPEMMRLYGKSLRGGLLLYGPPGCGKTYIARAVAGELGARFLSVGLSDVLDMWLGQSEQNLHALFQTARRNKPCLLFFDEIDALGRKRSLVRQSAGHDIVNQLLTELDSVEGNNDGVFVLAATNHPWDVDTALRRPGRLDRTLLVLPPDTAAREAILRLNLRDRPVGAVDLPALAVRTEGFSGADVMYLVESAVEYALEDSIARQAARGISAADFERALAEIRPSTRAWLDTARNYAQFANEGGAYDDLQVYLRANKLL